MDKTILKNITSLLGSQAINYIFPLLTYPHIIRIVGLSKFGEVQLVLTVMTFLTLFIEFGYSVRGPRDIAVAKHHNRLLSMIFSRTITHKLFVFLLVVLLVIAYALTISSQPYILYLGGCVYLFNLTMSPNWFFQGIEKMEFMALVDVVAKVIFTASVFLVIKQADDYVYILPLWGLGGLITAFAGLYIIIARYKVKFRWVSFYTLYKGGKKSYYLFVSNLAIHSIYNSNTILLGLLQGPTAVGIYAIADKVIKIPWTLATIFSHALYPRVCIINKKGVHEVVTFYKRVLPLPYLCCMMILAVIWLYSKEIVFLISHLTDERISNLMNLMVFCVILVISTTPFYHYLLANEKDKQLMRMFLALTVFNIIGGIVLIKYYTFWGAAITSILTLTLMLIFLILESGKILRIEKEIINHSFQ